MKTLAKIIGSILMLFATAFFVLGVITLGTCSAILTAPIIWGTGSGRKVRATVDVLGSLMRLASTVSFPVGNPSSVSTDMVNTDTTNIDTEK